MENAFDFAELAESIAPVERDENVLFVLVIDNIAMGIYPTMQMAFDSLALSGTLTFSVDGDIHRFGEIIIKNLPKDWTITSVRPCTKDDVPHSVFRE